MKGKKHDQQIFDSQRDEPPFLAQVVFDPQRRTHQKGQGISGTQKVIGFERQTNMMETEKQKLVEALVKLKKVHDVYVKATEEQRGRLLISCQFLIDRLVSFGYDRVFVETLLIGGKDFLDTWDATVSGTSLELDGVDAAQVIFK